MNGVTFKATQEAATLASNQTHPKPSKSKCQTELPESLLNTWMESLTNTPRMKQLSGEKTHKKKTQKNEKKR